MTFTTTPRRLRDLVSALQMEPPTRPIRAHVQSDLRRLADDRWVLKADIEDILLAMDPRLDPYDAANIDALTATFELAWQDVTPRPKRTSSGVLLHRAIAVAELAQLLIHLEALGFRVDPEPLVKLLLPTIESTKILSSAELAVFWYSRVRHRGAPLTISTETRPAPSCRRIVEWKTSGGYRLTAALSDADEPVHLTSTAPRFRRRSEPVRTTCVECGAEYYRGDPDSTAGHRREHRERMRYMDPKPHTKLLEAYPTHPAVAVVTTRSPAWMHREMYERARAFKREFGYDFIQWGSATGDDDPDARGMLFCDPQGSIVGACAFRRREHDGQNWWAMQWIWVCPSRRREGHLAQRWKAFREEYGDFAVEQPVSESMQSFLEKQGDSHLMHEPFTRQAGAPDPR